MGVGEKVRYKDTINVTDDGQPATERRRDDGGCKGKRSDVEIFNLKMVCFTS